MSTNRSYEYNALCPVCGFKQEASTMLKRWDGLWVCKKDWETRNILDFFRSRNDSHVLPFIYSDNDGIDVSPGAIAPLLCTVIRQQGFADIGTADCAKAS